jgi:hypothetical protein
MRQHSSAKRQPFILKKAERSGNSHLGNIGRVHRDLMAPFLKLFLEPLTCIRNHEDKQEMMTKKRLKARGMKV